MPAADPGIIRDRIIKPALAAINRSSPEAVRLVLATGMVETGYKTIIQNGGGPALSYWQIEPFTHNDIFATYLNPSPEGHYKGHPDILEGLHAISDRVGIAAEMSSNPLYAAAICRIKYLRAPAQLPNMYSLEDMGKYWCRYYNCGGKGTVARFMSDAAGVMSL